MGDRTRSSSKRDIGLQFTLHIYNRYTLQELVKIIRKSADIVGVDQIWINDNLGYQHTFACLAALAAPSLRVNLGTSVTNPYVRNPVDVAANFASVAQLLSNVNEARRREIGIGIARGAGNVTGQLVEQPKSGAMVREAVQFLRTLLDGEPVRFDDFPQLSAYHHLKRGQSARLRFSPVPGVDLPVYCAASGRMSIETAGRSGSIQYHHGTDFQRPAT